MTVLMADDTIHSFVCFPSASSALHPAAAHRRNCVTGAAASAPAAACLCVCANVSRWMQSPIFLLDRLVALGGAGGIRGRSMRAARKKVTSRAHCRTSASASAATAAVIVHFLIVSFGSPERSPPSPLSPQQQSLRRAALDPPVSVVRLLRLAIPAATFTLLVVVVVSHPGSPRRRAHLAESATTSSGQARQWATYSFLISCPMLYVRAAKSAPD